MIMSLFLDLLAQPLEERFGVVIEFAPAQPAGDRLGMQLQLDDLAASPSGLYKITSSIFLNVATLIITYVIVLLQSS